MLEALPSPTQISRRRVLVVDDHRTFAELLLRALDMEPDMECVGHAQSASAARRLVDLHTPDVVITDIRLGGEDGVSLTQSLTEAYPGILVIVLTAYADGELVRQAAAAGAAGIVPKDGALSGMLDVLRRASCTSMVMHPGLLASLLVRQDQQAPTATAVLTSREQQVIELLAQGLDATGIARRLGIAVSTCRGYIKTLLMKLDAHTQLEAVVTAARHGLIQVGRC